LKLAKSYVHRLLKKWVPETTGDDDLFEHEEYCLNARARDPKQNPYYFPGRESYDELREQLRAEADALPESSEKKRKDRESWVVEMATADASREYRRTGRVPTLVEALRKYPEFAGQQARSG